MGLRSLQVLTNDIIHVFIELLHPTTSNGYRKAHAPTNIYQFLLGAMVERRVEHWTCDKQVVGSNPTPGKSYITILDKLFTPMCLCHQAV